MLSSAVEHCTGGAKVGSSNLLASIFLLFIKKKKKYYEVKTFLNDQKFKDLKQEISEEYIELISNNEYKRQIGENE